MKFADESELELQGAHNQFVSLHTCVPYVRAICDVPICAFGMCIDYVLFWYVHSICAKFMCIVMCAAYVRVYVRYYVLQYVQTLCALLWGGCLGHVSKLARRFW